MAEAKVKISAQDRGSTIIDHVNKRLGILHEEGLAMGIAFAGITAAIGMVQQALQSLQQWIGESVRKYREFEKTMSEVSTLLDKQARELLPEMTKSIEAMSIAFGKSAVDLGRALYQIVSAGVDSAHAIDVLRSASKLATATLTDVETAVDALTTVLNAYGMGAEQAEHVSQIMFNTIKLGKLRMDDLADALGFIVPIAAQAGISFEEISAAMATLTKQGIDAHKASRSLRQVINTLIAPSEEAKDKMVDLGIAYDDLVLEAKGLAGTLNMINDAAQEQIGVISSLIPNVQALNAVVGLTGQQYETFQSSLDVILNDLQSLDEAYSEVADKSNFAMRKQEALGEAIDRAMGEAAEPATRFFNRMIMGFEAIIAHAGNVNAAITDIRNRIKQAQSEVEQAFDTEKIQAYAAEFNRLSAYAEKQAALADKLAMRQKVYMDELARMKEEREIFIQTHEYKESLKYIPLALEDATYASKIYDKTTRELVNSIRTQRQEIERLSIANDEYSLQSMRNQLQIMKIQHAAMGSRRGLTRSQKRQIQELQKANDQLRINVLENQIAQEEIKQRGLNADEKALEMRKMFLAEQISILEDSYNRDLELMNVNIAHKELLISEYNEYIKTAQEESDKAWDTYYSELETRTKTWSRNMIDELNKVLYHPLMRGGVQPRFLGFSAQDIFRRIVLGQRQRGGFIPQTGFYLMHRGEQVVPRGKETGTITVAPGAVQITIQSQGNTTGINTVELARALRRAMYEGLLDASGISRARLR
jgi:TP901 family phage tail tape measure protein